MVSVFPHCFAARGLRYCSNCQAVSHFFDDEKEEQHNAKDNKVTSTALITTNTSEFPTLALTPEQTARVRTILNGTVEQANAAKAKYPPQSAPLTAELKRINIASQRELQVVLGPTKFKQLQANQRKMAAEMQQRQKQ